MNAAIIFPADQISCNTRADGAQNFYDTDLLSISNARTNCISRLLPTWIPSRMKLIFAVPMFLIGAFFIEAQQSSLRFNSTTIPARLITTNRGEICPPEEQREAVQNEVKTNVSALLRNVFYNVSQYCGGGSWTRIVYINMTNTSQQCPGTFREYSTPVRTCGRRSGPASCDSATFTVNGARYTRVRGRVIVYQVGSPSAFWPFLTSRAGATSIDGYYLDGISITHGSPRQHIWSFAASPSENTLVAMIYVRVPVL